MNLSNWRLLALVLAASVGSMSSQTHAAEPLQYNRDIRPILAENCFACHGPDSAARKAKLRLDDRDAAIDRGAIEPKKPDASELVSRLFLPDTDKLRMPPPSSHKELKPEQKAMLKQWVAEGANYQPHWAFITPAVGKIPSVTNAARVSSPIDAFVLAALERKGLGFAPEADRRTLARRLSLDLIGLPPKPADVEEFVNDKSPNYYETYVDKLMASPHWGEHRGRYWLDAARYADTHGIHFDNFREMWSYRDWVLNAFNTNMKFDQFTREQLAGDLLPNPTIDQKIATGFNRCNITTNEGGAISEEYLVLYTRDRTETANQVWLGLTAGCAVCHDHKFDPISQREFYSMAAFFNNTTQNAMDGNIKDTPPIIPVVRSEDRAKLANIEKQLAEVKTKLAERTKAAKPDFQTWLKSSKPTEFAKSLPADKLHFHAKFNEISGKTITGEQFGKPIKTETPAALVGTPGKFQAKSLLLKGPSGDFPEVGDFDTAEAFSYGLWLKPQKKGNNGAVLARMDSPGNNFTGWDLWLQNDAVAAHIINSWPSDAVKVVTKATLKANEWTHVFVTYDGSAKQTGVKIYFNGVVQPTNVEADTLKGSIRTKTPLRIGQRTEGQGAPNVGLEDLRIYSRNLSQSEVERLAKSSHVLDLIGKADRTPKETADLFAWWLGAVDSPTQELNATVAKLNKDESAIRAGGTIAHVSNEKPGMAEAFILTRGEYDRRADKVEPATPKALPAFPKDLPKNRLGFAEWLLTPGHPLTGRVTVNRYWQELFGTGLVQTPGDFGITGEQPSHPELLDWLAIEFQSHWDTKRFFKLLVMSSTYRQAATITPEKLERDPFNVWLSRGPRFRMDAEMVRDYALSASGLLVPTIGGPSVKPYQPEGVWEAVAMPGSNTRDYKADTGANLYRRSMYTFWKRAAPPASMEILNAPNRETCTVKRERTNTPLQALLTLNDVQFVEAARVLAEGVLSASKDDPARLNDLAMRLLARPWKPTELTIIQGVLADLRKTYIANPADAAKLIAYGERKADPKLNPSELAAWTMLVNNIMNLDEVLNK